jgi:glutathione S-transferase
MRPWVALVAAGIPFTEVRVLLDQPDTAANIARFSHAGRVPVLLAGEMTIWDSLAICEYLAEQFPEKHLWPQDVAARAMARSVAAEMHSGFPDLRSAMSMNIKARLPGRGRTPGAQADIGRICEIWEECLSRFGHHRFLFGDFSIADAFYAPVVMRFKTYGVALAPALQAYCDRMLAHPAVARWVEEAMLETEIAAAHEDELPD